MLILLMCLLHCLFYLLFWLLSQGLAGLDGLLGVEGNEGDNVSIVWFPSITLIYIFVNQ